MGRRLSISRNASLLISLMISYLVTRGDAGATLSVKFITYNNPNHRDWNNQACDVFINTHCDNLFTICLDNIGGNNYFGSGDCRYGLSNTGEFANQDEIMFGRDMYSVPNPIVVHISSWQNIRLKVEVRDDDSSHSGHDLVDRFYREWRAIPGTNNTNNPSVSNIVIAGTRTNTQKTSLNVEFSVKCDAHYYGTNCATYCRYSNDGSGHYRCTNDGNKECLNGWEDVSTSCTVASDDCLRHACQHGATCVDGPRRYTCRCPRGYTGTRCETEVDECVSAPCQNNGTCVNQVGSFRCECPDAYPQSISPVCGVHTCLFDNPCENGGTCYGAGLCACMPNYTGSRCEMHYCQKNCIFCMNGGHCTGTTCTCPKGTLGERCEIDVCDVIDCFNGGVCENGTCVCPTGYKGKYCHENVDDCQNMPCGDGGFCIDGVDSYTCQCQGGFTGVNCQIQPTTTLPPTTLKTTEKTTKRGLNNQNKADYLSDKPGVQAVRTKDSSDKMFMVMIIIVVALFVVIIILIALVCREKVRRKLKENREPRRSDAAPSSNFENPVYTMERGPRAQSNLYDHDGYLAPQAIGGSTDGAGGGFSNKVYEGTHLEAAYSEPPRGPARPVHHNPGGDPIYDQPRIMGGIQPYPPPYSEGAYSRSIDTGAVSMNDIKARVEDDQTYEELNHKVPLP